MPLPRFERLPPETRTRLLSAAQAEFSAHGFDGASLNRIIAEAGISKGAMYYYFADKADLFATVCRAAFEELAVAAGPWEPPESAEAFWTRLGERMGNMAGEVAARPELAPLGRAMYAAPEELRSAVVEKVAQWIERGLRTGQELGAVRDDLPTDLLVEAVTGLLIAIDRWFALHWTELSPETVSEINVKLFGLCRDVLSPRQETRVGQR
jgi:AcrR family transcriptional regulator